jgi:hypothetical protein
VPIGRVAVSARRGAIFSRRIMSNTALCTFAVQMGTGLT